MKRARRIRIIKTVLALAAAYGLLAVAQLDPHFNGIDLVAWIVFGIVLYRTIRTALAGGAR